MKVIVYALALGVLTYVGYICYHSEPVNPDSIVESSAQGIPSVIIQGGVEYEEIQHLPELEGNPSGE